MSRRTNFWLALACGSLGLIQTPAQAAERSLAGQKLIQALTEEVSGEKAWRYTDSISRFDRVQASPGFHEAASWIKDELLKMGYTDATIEAWPSDGSLRYSTYRSVIGWKAKKGELWMTSPSRERLCSFAELPLCLVKHSGPARVEADLVDVGSGMGEASYGPKDVKGMIVLATGPTSEVMREAVLERGALGVLTYFGADTRPGYPNMVRYTALWPKWEDREKIGFAFNLSKNQGAVLKRMLEEGRSVVLRAEVEAEFFPSNLETLTATLPGLEGDREIMIVGHLCHPTPSANDNASGSGGMLEMARALKEIVDSGLVERPRRTIRFLWVPEFNGTVPYVQAHLERTRKTLAVINCDMIGEDLHLTGGIFNIFRTPDSMPTVLNDVVADFAKLADRLDLKSLNGSSHPFAWRILPYSGGSDHVVFNDGALRAASVMLNRDDVFHHTSLDAMDKVDPTELRRSCFVALGAAYYLAAAGDGEALDMARIVARDGLGRLGADYYDSLAAMDAKNGPDELFKAYRQVINVITHSGRREVRSILSARAFAAGQAVDSEIQAAKDPLESLMLTLSKEATGLYRKACATIGTTPRPLSLDETEKKLVRIVPVRKADFVGPLDLSYVSEKLGPDILREAKLRGDAAYEALNFVDGKMSVHDIALAVSAEFGPISPVDVQAFFLVLEKAGLISLKAV